MVFPRRQSTTNNYPRRHRFKENGGMRPTITQKSQLAFNDKPVNRLLSTKRMLGGILLVCLLRGAMVLGDLLSIDVSRGGGQDGTTTAGGIVTQGGGGRSSDVAEKQQQEMNATPNKKKNLCKRSDIRHGKWVGKINSTNSSTETAVIPMHAPNRSQNYDACNVPDLYQWQIAKKENENDSSCEFQQEFNSELFCDLMKNAVILFIGDSITWEMYSSLVHLMDGPQLQKSVHLRSIHKRIAIVINVCGDNHVTLIYRWNKHLSNQGTSVAIERMLNETFPTMIVLNTGAHYQHDTVYHKRMDHALDLIAGWQTMCQDRNLPCPFFWRTTPPGIFNCKNFTRPVNNITMMEEYVASNPLHDWENFRHQNELALQKLESSKLSSYNIIDAYEVGIQRPELQVSPEDCLHHCQPAAADAYNTIMLHYLQVDRTSEDLFKIATYEYPYNRTTNILSSGMDVDWSQDPTPYLS